MNLGQQSSQQINDDQELAQVLAGVNGAGDAAESVNNPAMGAMEPPAAPALPPMPEPPVAAPESELSPAEQVGAMQLDQVPESETPSSPVSSPDDGDLGGVKQEAISELRPLVDKLNLPAEEKFDTYLLLIRSTDDKSLIAPAHEAAKNIADDARRAQALLDVIKEIDFLSNPSQL